MTEVAEQAWACPRDGAVMVPMGRRAGAWRCPTCRGIFVDVQGMRPGRAGDADVPPRIVLNVAASLFALFLFRRLLRGRKGRRAGSGQG